MADITQNTNDIPELQSPFEQLREVDADGREWWNSRKLARVMGYGKYWNFERVIAKAQAWASRKGYHLGEHFVEITEMAELGSGAVREVTSIRLSRAACMAVVMNADQKKEMVKVARQYFSSTMTRCGGEEYGVIRAYVQGRTRQSTSAGHLRHKYFLALTAEDGGIVWGDCSNNQLPS